MAATGPSGQEDANPANNTASLTTTVRKPVPVLAVAAPAIGLAGEAIPVTLTYSNAGSVAATGVVVTVTLAKDVYYSGPLDPTGSPRPTGVTRRPDGTTLLTWAVPDVAAGGASTITFRVRPSLLTNPGTAVAFQGTMTTGADNGCPALSTAQSASTTVNVPATSGWPMTTALRSLVTSTWTAESLARIHATDQRFDGRRCSRSSASSTPAPSHNYPTIFLRTATSRPGSSPTGVTLSIVTPVSR